ncbi:MAG: hypothetical protein Q3998_05235 [Porphyromonas sp.]|nr:hypothetical protein [Porphyromonas sp.]
MTHKIIYALLIILLVSGCGKRSENRSDNEDQTERSRESHDLKVSILKGFFYSEDVPKAPTDRLLELKDILLEDIDKLLQEDLMHCLYLLDYYIDGELLNLSERESHFLQAYANAKYEQQETGTMPPDSILQKEKQYNEIGLDLAHAGEGVYEIYAGERFYKDFEKYLPEEYREIRSLYFKSRFFFEDASVTVPWQTLGELIARYEAYADKNAEMPYTLASMSSVYNKVQYAYLFGLDNSPLTSERGDGTLAPEIKSEYERFADAYPQSPTTKLIRILLSESKITVATFEKVQKARQESDYPLLTADVMMYGEE